MVFSEKFLERKMGEKIRAKNGLFLKWVSPSFSGVPDRIVLMPGGKCFFVEMKTTGKKLKHRQIVIRRLLESLGFTFYVVDSIESLENCIYEIEQE
jgi:hypothetical protein